MFNSRNQFNLTPVWIVTTLAVAVVAVCAVLVEAVAGMEAFL